MCVCVSYAIVSFDLRVAVEYDLPRIERKEKVCMTKLDAGRAADD